MRRIPVTLTLSLLMPTAALTTFCQWYASVVSAEADLPTPPIVSGDTDPTPQADALALSENWPPLHTLCEVGDLGIGMRFEERSRRGIEWIICEPAGLVDGKGNRIDGGYWWPGDKWSDSGWTLRGYLPEWKGATPDKTNWMVREQPLAVRVDTGEARLWCPEVEVRRVH